MTKVDRNHPTELNTVVTTEDDDNEKPVASENTDHAGLLTVAEAARVAGVSRSTLYRSIRNKTLHAVVSDDGNKRVAQADVLSTFNVKSSDPKNRGTTIGSSVQIAPDPEIVKQLQDALEAEQAKVQQLQHQLATVDNDQDAPASAPAQNHYEAPRRRSKLVRSVERSFEVLVGGALVFVIAVVLIIALIFSFGGFSNVPTISEF